MTIDLTAPAADLGVWLIILGTTDPAVRRRVATDPTVVAIVERAASLTPDHRRRVSEAYRVHFNTYRTTLLQIRHRIRHAGGPNNLTIRALDERVHEILDCPGGGPCQPYHTCKTTSVTSAVMDAIFAHLAREYLTDDQMRLFNGPWHDEGETGPGDRCDDDSHGNSDGGAPNAGSPS